MTLNHKKADWQPAKTAPKDGSVIRIQIRHTEGFNVYGEPSNYVSTRRAAFDMDIREFVDSYGNIVSFDKWVPEA